MTHPLIEQLRFTRSEWQRALKDVTEADAVRRLEPMNSISWIVGHLAWQEQGYWLWWRGEPLLDLTLNDLVGYGKPANTPPMADMLSAWNKITDTTNPYLDTLTPALLETYHVRDGQQARENIGTMLLRMIYHYWFHIGEILAIRQQLGQTNLPEFVGSLGRDAPFRARGID